MKQFPPIPPVEDAPELFESGHLWIQEHVDGATLRFRLRDSGAFEFGDRSRVFEPGEVPVSYRHAVRHVRERVDRAALREAVDDVESVVFVGVATHRRAVDYDWDRLPSVLGVEVWNDDEGRFLPPDAVEQAYDRLGLEPVNTVQKEVRAVDFDPESYDVPASAWDDGPAAGVVLRNKTGDRATLLRPEVRDADASVPVDATPGELAEEYVTRQRVEAVVAELEDEQRRVAVDTVTDRIVERLAREEHARLFGGDRTVDPAAFRSAVAERTSRLLDA
ncbi:RNA ligase family protein [Halorussus halobius]|uniref:RNA ligase family protein n=1 Tax=Halorussus halobius TaxID=1710537 RepID=UPI0010924B44|nr:RNA ligase family protein [Halorussus halobius]